MIENLLLDPLLYRLYSSGASYLAYKAEDDEDMLDANVSTILSLGFLL